MNLERVKAHARIRTSRSWPARPVRSMLWWLLKPYFQALADELEDRIARLERQVGLPSESAGPPDHDGLALEIDGLRKDVKAIAHRLAGLEEEAASVAGSERP